ncbi:MAG: phosphoenolpyruvate synthase [Halobacteriales archaeon]
MTILWLEAFGADDIGRVGGKGASLGELASAGLTVPPAFVVTADTYRRFVRDAGIEEALRSAVDVDVDDADALAEAETRAAGLVEETPFPEALREELLGAYDELVDDAAPFVAVRSSATAEDLPDASFAGQQETFLNVDREGLLDAIRSCWASLFTQRAIYYREEQGFGQEVDMAVVVQRMVDADRSGVLFTSHPSTGDERMIVEAAWGLGEAVVSGAVSPDNYVVDRESGEVLETTVATKKTMHERDADTGETVEVDVPDDIRDRRVLSEADLERLRELAREIEAHYGLPQDVEWAMLDDELYVLQSRPITTIAEAPTPNGGTRARETTTEGKLLDGLGASPGQASGAVRIVLNLDQLDQVGEGDILVTQMTTPDMVPAMQRAGAIVTDEGGMTSHAAIVSRELGVPAVVGTGTATTDLDNGQTITVDGDKGQVHAGRLESAEEREPIEEARPKAPVKPMTATEVKVNVSIPEAAERAAATGADGVGLLRIEHMVLSLGSTPERFVADNGHEAYVHEIVDGVREVAEEFYPRPVRVRTLDAPTDEFRSLNGGEEEPDEHNPMLGYRGIRRSLDRPDMFDLELQAFSELYDMGYDNIEIMFPLVNDAEDVLAAKARMAAVGIDVDKRSWGVMIETPASALGVAAMAEAGIDFASFGTNDLTQYTLAVDRNNELVADRFDELHPAVLDLIGRTIRVCREHGVDTGICGQAGSRPRMVRFLVDAGISSISANIDAVRDVQHEVKRIEQKLILDSIR